MLPQDTRSVLLHWERLLFHLLPILVDPVHARFSGQRSIHRVLSRLLHGDGDKLDDRMDNGDECTLNCVLRLYVGGVDGTWVVVGKRDVGIATAKLLVTCNLVSKRMTEKWGIRN